MCKFQSLGPPFSISNANDCYWREADIRQTPTLAKNRADSGNAQLARQDLLARSSLGARLDTLVAKAAEHPVVFVADRILAVEPLETADRKMTVGRQRMPYFSEIYAHQGFAIIRK
jgi:hypothetical protein